jgi:hypothetical protein
VIRPMKFAGRLSRVKTIVEQDSIERGLNKLARTYTTQMEVLKRYRTGGEQNITVQHVSVSEGPGNRRECYPSCARYHANEA